jgi:histidinol-phosphate aminotransferase
MSCLNPISSACLMNLTQLANSRILEQPIYEPGKPIEEVAREYDLQPDQICKLASNENPWGASRLAKHAAKDALEKLHLYPDGAGHILVTRLAALHSIQENQFVLGNGSNEIIEFLGHVFLEPGDEVVCGEFAFLVYKLVALLMGAKPVEVEMPDLCHDLAKMRGAITDRTKLVFLPSPNNPTGTANTENEIFEFVRSLPQHVIFCFDEAYAEYLDNPPDLRPLIEEGRKVICLRTFSKIHGLAALRIGYGYGSTEMIGLLQRARQPFNANAVAQAAAIGALSDNEWVTQCRQRNITGLEQISSGLEKLGIEYIPSHANFILAKPGNGNSLFLELQKHGIITRALGHNLSDYLRISVGTEDENTRLLKALEKAHSIYGA